MDSIKSHETCVWLIRLTRNLLVISSYPTASYLNGLLNKKTNFLLFTT